jgi:hypothetical protein
MDPTRMTTTELHAYLQLAKASSLVRPPPGPLREAIEKEWSKRPPEEQAAAEAQDRERSPEA